MLIGLSQLYVVLGSKKDEVELFTADETSAESFIISKPKRLTKENSLAKLKNEFNNSEANKIKSNIKINTGNSSFITITSTIVTNGKMLTINKIAEVTYEINIPELDLNISVASDILLNSNQTQKLPVNSTKLAKSKN